jgi:hypothetical protein
MTPRRLDADVVQARLVLLRDTLDDLRSMGPPTRRSTSGG